MSINDEVAEGGLGAIGTGRNVVRLVIANKARFRPGLEDVKSKQAVNACRTGGLSHAR
jgi:hypothetical protein